MVTRSPRWRRTRTVLALGNLVALAAIPTLAAFTDDATSQAQFSTGSVDLVLDGDTDDDQAFSSLSSADMVPGDESYGALPVTNSGSMDFTYAMVASAGSGDTGLADAMTLGVRVVPGATCDASTYAASGTTLVGDSTVLTSATMGSRALSAGTGETLCFHVTLPSSTPDTIQGLSVTAQLAFTATQS